MPSFSATGLIIVSHRKFLCRLVPNFQHYFWRDKNLEEKEMKNTLRVWMLSMIIALAMYVVPGFEGPGQPPLPPQPPSLTA
jgi:hypothetical protein